MSNDQGMTYRQIRDYVNANARAIESTLEGRVANVLERVPVGMPKGVYRWITHEVLPTLVRTGSYQYPEALDAVCPYTLPIEPARLLN